jgi:hypothetical protein
MGCTIACCAIVHHDDKTSKTRLNISDDCYLITYGGPWGTVPELLFEKKQLIPALQQLLIQTNHTL